MVAAVRVSSKCGEGSAVHTLCSEGLAVGDKGDHGIMARLVDASGGQRGSATPSRGACSCKENGRILLANSNQWYFNNLVKRPCHKTPYRCPHRLNLSSQSSRSCALPNIKALKDKDLEFANSNS